MFAHWLFRLTVAGQCALIGACLVLSTAGCERKERVLDVQTPGADVEVDRNVDTGEVEVDVNDND